MRTTSKRKFQISVIVIASIAFIVGIVFISNSISNSYLTPEDASAASLGDLYSPLLDNSSSRITQPYNINSGGSHWGIDIGWVSSKPNPKDIYAAGSGTVIENSSYCAFSLCGNFITIKHSASLYTRYQHLETKYVSPGQSVDENTKIGLMGTTGNSTGVHLHFEVLTNPNVYRQYDTSLFLNPTSTYLRSRGSNPPSENPTNPPAQKVACGSFGCATDSDCEGYNNNASGTTTCNERVDGDASKQYCSRICPNGYSDTNKCVCATTPLPTDEPVPSVSCQAMDINGDKKLDYIDMHSFVSIYGVRCGNDTSNIDPTGCKGQDYNKDGLINYIDLSAMVSNYSPKVTNCTGMPGL
jgi:hypothetical protein